MGYIVLGTMALVCLVAGLLKSNERLYIISSPFWLMLGFYCFAILDGANPVAYWNGWLGIFSFMGGMYIVWDAVWGELGKKRKSRKNGITYEDSEYEDEYEYGYEDKERYPKRQIRQKRIVRNPGIVKPRLTKREKDKVKEEIASRLRHDGEQW